MKEETFSHGPTEAEKTEKCPDCGMGLRLGQYDTEEPKEGDELVCVYCATWWVYKPKD